MVRILGIARHKTFLFLMVTHALQHPTADRALSSILPVRR
jgi:hypothetical protein